jgi:hypothetical protein
MKIIHKTIRKAYDNWKPCREIRTYHYAAAFDGNKMIAFAQNNPIKMNRKAHRIGQQFNIPTYIEYSYPHAESHLISKLLDRYNSIDPNWSICVLRINRKGLILGSKPCDNCQKILNSLDLYDISYSDDNGNFVCPTKTIKVDALTMPIPVV